jgi:ribonuclease G
MKKIYVNRREDGYLTALAENGKLVELIRDDDNDPSVAGNIYAGIVKKIKTGLMFLDVGLDVQAFLDTGDHKERGLFCHDKLTVKQGDKLIVQILRDGIGDKGPAATSNISHAGRFVVLSKSVGYDKISVSKKITDESEIIKLKTIAEKHASAGFSVILRSAAKYREESEIAQEIHTVASKLAENLEKWHYAKGPVALLAQPPIIKTLREISSDDIDEIVVDDAAAYALLDDCYGPKLRHYDGDEPIFSRFFLKAQIDKVRDRRIWLKSGAFIVIEQTEACVVIDVNSGKQTATKKGDAALKVNMEAAKEIAYQMRLRNLSGIIIVDFITMKSPDDTHSLAEFLRKETAKDRMPATVVGMTALGLMEITRKRIRPPF